MSVTDNYATPEQLDEHRMEIENRIRNLFWTVSGDYSLEIDPDIYDFARSRYIPLYDAIRQGAFSRYFDSEALSTYLAKKVCLGAEEKPLLELSQLCIEAAVYPIVQEEREGVEAIRRQAFLDILANEDHAGAGEKNVAEEKNAAGEKSFFRRKEKPFFEQVKIAMMRQALAEDKLSESTDMTGSDDTPGSADMPDNAYMSGSVVMSGSADTPGGKTLSAGIDMDNPRLIYTLTRIASLAGTRSTDDIITVIDEIYNSVYDPDFESRKGNLQQVLDLSEHTLRTTLEQEFLDDETMDNVLKKVLKGMRRDMLRLEVPSERRKTKGMTAAQIEAVHFAELKEEDRKKVRDYVDLSFGRSYLRENEQKGLAAKLCRGVHHGCKLHYTEGILHAPVKKNNQYRYAEMLTEKNRMYYYMNNRVVRRNILNLTDTLKKILALKSQTETWRDRSGKLRPARLWKLNRSEDDRFFDKTSRVSDAGFVVDILLDASGSQLKRQGQVAAQGYIIAEALSAAGIPHRMMSFCTFWDYTILHRFRDYDDGKDMNLRIFEYSASANNRDGLAIRAVADDLNQRPEEHKILIVLSDGRPNDVGRTSQTKRTSNPYVGDEAVKDTAFEVRRARQIGISVLGIFAGSVDDLAAEKKIFGKDFAYIQKLNNFAPVVGTYLCRQIDGAE